MLYPGLQTVQYKATVFVPTCHHSFACHHVIYGQRKWSPKSPDMEDSCIYCMLSKQSQTNNS